MVCSHKESYSATKRMKYQYMLQTGWILKAYAGRKKPDAKTHVYDSIYMKSPRIGKAVETESREAITAAGRR